MTLIEMVVVGLVGCVLGALAGAVSGSLNGAILVTAFRGAFIGLMLGFFVPVLLVIAAVQWRRFREWQRIAHVRSSRGVSQASLDMIDAALQGTTEVSAIAWHRRADFDRIDETKGTPTPRG